MKKIFLVLISVGTMFCAQAQPNVRPAAVQKAPIVIKNATIHTGDGAVIENGIIVIENGKITAVGKDVKIPAGAEVTDAGGKQVYPGLVLPTSNLGLIEISAVKASNDTKEIGDLNPNIRSIVAYNTDSKVINTLRSNGILAANIIPQGDFLAGSSSIVQLDAWNWQDAAIQTDGGMHLYMPTLMPRPSFGRGGFAGPNAGVQTDPVKEGLEKIEKLKSFFKEAKAYLGSTGNTETNLKFESVKNLFSKKQKLYVHANTVKQMLVALDFVKEFGFEMVIVGASEGWQIANLLKQNNVSVILDQLHRLPTGEDDDVDQPYKTAAALQKAGVVFALSDDDSQNRGRNLAFNAGTAAAYGLTKEEALAAITSSAAKIMGVSDKIGSIAVGKDANIIISSGDILDMRTNNVTDAFIQGRKINLDDKQKQLNERYEEKYNIKQKKGF
ncbi:MAG: amidohydrolase family protein [Chitinophagaceae bacterium]|jgi:imidazolonepropionase-like amidohydrolase|nr:amidohydrolase family protein [Chitinophagaceae bacterium]MBK9465078.1 amidohydrolase family protein [Chitinophagaceae bacterium]MBK9660189.1 amidohydrolase family protein [Chitinophagaceae bacterium]MBP6231912.1 amidohydrolase family protein [Chitinophagaceae bacterium]MBP6415291.1 amidohydrolase family protein [Chitinophagaceae bacterium]